MALSPKVIVCATAFSLGIASTADALPINFFGNNLTESPGLNKCLPQCAVSEWLLPDAPLSTMGTNPSAASLHADLPPPWNNSKGVASFSVASLHADIPPPWANWIGEVNFPSQNSNNIEVPGGPNSSVELSESVAFANVALGSPGETKNATVGFFDNDNDVSAGASVTDLVEITEVVVELGPGSTNQTGTSAAAVLPGTLTVQEASPSVPSPSNSVPEPTSVGLVALGLVLRQLLPQASKSLAAKSN